MTDTVHTTSGACLGVGPILWRYVNREFYNSVSDPDPVEREWSHIIENYDTMVERYRYKYPAAHAYYRLLDDFNARPPLSDEKDVAP